MTFRSHWDPDRGRSPPGAYRVAVGRRGCTVLPEESESYRCAALLGGNGSGEGSGADPPSLSRRPLPTSRRKEFVDVLVCELEPGGPAAVEGPAKVVLTVEEPTRPSAFHVYGSATLGGFVFVVRFTLVGPLAGSGRFGSLTHPYNPMSAQEPHVSALHPPFGPRGGGTHLSLHGSHLSAGSSWRVTVNGSECALTGQPRYSPALPWPDTAGSPHGTGTGSPCSPAVLTATAVVSPVRAMGQSDARLPPLVAWAQPG